MNAGGSSIISVITDNFSEAPVYHIFLEGLLLIWVLWLIFHKSYNPSDRQSLTEKEKETLINEWIPEPLVPDYQHDHPVLNQRVIKSKAGKYIVVGDCECINFATHNYLGLIGEPKIEEDAIQTVRKYGVGSCGPRGFYGTLDIHLDLEKRIAEFMGLEEAAVYSYGFSTVASAIPAYAKRGDVIFVDSQVNFAIQKGLDASRSKVVFFKHNDMEDLENHLIEQEALDKLNPKKAQVTRRFLIVEGIYLDTGNICPLPHIVDLRKKYKLRLFVDESISFGILGPKGRGVTDYFQIPKEEVDLVMGSMEFALGSIGGFCVGSSFIVEHQRLSGLGYCFSASLPPLLTKASITAINLIEDTPEMLQELQEKCEFMHQTLLSCSSFKVFGHIHSPVKHITFKDDKLTNWKILNEVAQECTRKGVAVVAATYLEKEEKFPRISTIRLTVNRLFNHTEITKGVQLIDEIFKNFTKAYNL